MVGGSKNFVKTENFFFPASEQDPKAKGRRSPQWKISIDICIYDLQEKKLKLLGSDAGRYLIR
jgi:hypothetical protein